MMRGGSCFCQRERRGNSERVVRGPGRANEFAATNTRSPPARTGGCGAFEAAVHVAGLAEPRRIDGSACPAEPSLHAWSPVSACTTTGPPTRDGGCPAVREGGLRAFPAANSFAPWRPDAHVPSANPPIRQSANPPIRQSANPPIRQSANPPIRQSANPPIRQSANPPIRQSANPPIRQSANPPIRQSANPPIRQSANPPIRQSANPPIRRSADPPIHRSADLLPPHGFRIGKRRGAGRMTESRGLAHPMEQAGHGAAAVAGEADRCRTAGQA
jgi:hypothetical protein